MKTVDRGGDHEKRTAGRALLAGFICLVFSGIGLWVAARGSGFTGGIPMLPDGWNQTLARIVFGAGAFLTALIGIYAFYDAHRLWQGTRSGGKPHG